MFALSLVDHLRLTFGHVIYTHRAHASLAWRQARWNRWLLGAEAILMLAAALASVAMMSTGQTTFAVVSAVAASLSVCAVIVRLVFDFDGRAAAHRACSARLWHIREQYRALLADLKDEYLTIDRVRERRDELAGMLRAVYEHVPPADRAAYEAARRALPVEDEGPLTDEEIDRFLPLALQKGEKPASS
jgi:hypothetical protein